MQFEREVAASAGEVNGERRVPGEQGIWALIIGDLLVFTIFFLTYAVYRGEQPQLFGESQTLLDQNLGLANTLILLTSSVLVVLGLHRVRTRRPGAGLFLCAILLGIAFL